MLKKLLKSLRQEPDNSIVNVDGKPCKEGQYRYKETNRCRNKCNYTQDYTKKGCKSKSTDDILDLIKDILENNLDSEDSLLEYLRSKNGNITSSPVNINEKPKQSPKKDYKKEIYNLLGNNEYHKKHPLEDDEWPSDKPEANMKGNPYKPCKPNQYRTDKARCKNRCKVTQKRNVKNKCVSLSTQELKELYESLKSPCDQTQPIDSTYEQTINDVMTEQETDLNTFKKLIQGGEKNTDDIKIDEKKVKDDEKEAEEALKKAEKKRKKAEKKAMKKAEEVEEARRKAEKKRKKAEKKARKKAKKAEKEAEEARKKAEENVAKAINEAKKVINKAEDKVNKAEDKVDEAEVEVGEAEVEVVEAEDKDEKKAIKKAEKARKEAEKARKEAEKAREEAEEVKRKAEEKVKKVKSEADKKVNDSFLEAAEATEAELIAEGKDIMDNIESIEGDILGLLKKSTPELENILGEKKKGELIQQLSDNELETRKIDTFLSNNDLVSKSNEQLQEKLSELAKASPEIYTILTGI